MTEIRQIFLHYMPLIADLRHHRELADLEAVAKAKVLIPEVGTHIKEQLESGEIAHISTTLALYLIIVTD